MADIFNDIIKALLDYWQARLGSEIPVKPAFQDERLATRENRTYPMVTLQVIGTPLDKVRALSCPEDIIAVDMDAGIARIKPAPVPVNLEFQLDTWAAKQTEARAISATLLHGLGSKTRDPITTTAERSFYIMPLPEAIDPAQYDKDDSLWRGAYRFYIETWLTSEEYSEIRIVLRRDFAINTESINDPEE